jgi:hypothetical protein
MLMRDCYVYAFSDRRIYGRIISTNASGDAVRAIPFSRNSVFSRLPMVVAQRLSVEEAQPFAVILAVGYALRWLLGL